MAKQTEKPEVVLEKSKRIEEIRKELNKNYGKGSVMGANEKPKFHECISTGSLGLDKALGIGGLAKGKIIEIMGWESSGKTTIALQTVAEAHKNPDSYCGFVDAEHAFDATYAQNLGVDLNRLEISQPDYGEQGLEIASKWAESGEFDIVIVDSVAALVPKSEVDRDMGESSMGKHALLMSQAMRKLTPLVAKSNCIMIFINQLREKIGIMFGSPDTTPGGNALKFYAAMRLVVSRSTTKDNSIMDGETKIGNLTKVKVIKNKTSPPFKECEFDIIYGQGIDKYGELLTYGVETKILIKSGHSIIYGENIIGRGKESAIQFLKDNEEFYNEIRTLVIDSYKPKEFIPSPAELVAAQS